MQEQSTKTIDIPSLKEEAPDTHKKLTPLRYADEGTISIADFRSII